MKASAIRYLIDAGPLVASLNAGDQWHTWAVRVMTALDEQVATSEVAVAEACHLLKPHRPSLFGLIHAIASRRIVPLSPWNHADRITALLEKYPLMDVGDASLVVLSEQFPKAKIVTTDTRDFTIYRRFRDEPLPLIHP